MFNSISLFKVRKPMLKSLLAVSLTASGGYVNAGLHVYSIPFDDQVTVRIFDNGKPVISGEVTVYNSDNRKLETLNIENGKAVFRFPVVGLRVKIVARVDGLTGVAYQSRESRMN
ncbi:hypothetical protein [Parendozoicomonas sp. Alg238-R29]|uniref:hypothetical protein n=1 Tax=Parendozoicomonas sp. Alg238-R29 TaxID=2993446 RepID=UPI00248F431C|nr:hypothetical protein [Parendozoicomonas sp. Alg238-R29]